MKTAKKWLALLLAVLMLAPVCGLPLNAVQPLPAQAKTYNVGDIITFGGYPQSRVTDSTTIAALNSIAAKWYSYGYYSGDKHGTNGSLPGAMRSGDWMKYCDVCYNNAKYRGVIFTQYRPTGTGWISDSAYSVQDDHGYYINQVYWFLWEPIKWVVLDPTAGLVMSEKVLDSQAFNNTIYYTENTGFAVDSEGDPGFTMDPEGLIAANQYESSSIRFWLNNDFYYTFCSASNRKKIKITELDCEDSVCSDRIFLLSADDVVRKEYGFTSNASRKTTSSDYTKCQGSYRSVFWRLRSVGSNSERNMFCFSDGSIQNYAGASDISVGVRPAFQFKNGIVEDNNPNGGNGVTALQAM